MSPTHESLEIEDTTINSHIYAWPMSLAPTRLLPKSSDVMYFVDMFSLRIFAVVHDIEIWTFKARAGLSILHKLNGIESMQAHRCWLPIVAFMNTPIVRATSKPVTISINLGKLGSRSIGLLASQVGRNNLTMQYDEDNLIMSSTSIVALMANIKHSFKLHTDKLNWDGHTPKVEKYQDIISIRNDYINEHNASQLRELHQGQSPDSLYNEQAPTIITTGAFLTEIFESQPS